MKKIIIIVVLLAALLDCQAQKMRKYWMKAPDIVAKTNLLADISSTIGVGTEFKFLELFTIDVALEYNAWTFKNNRKWKHILVQPEIRIWVYEPFNGHFFGFHGMYSFYNYGNLPFPDYISKHRIEGWLAGAGMSYGYHWIINKSWSIEGTLGVGYAYMNYNGFYCEECGEKLGRSFKHYLGPTKAAVNLIYTFK